MNQLCNSLRLLSFKNGPSQATCSFLFLTIYRIKTADFNRIQTRIVGVERENTDHLSTTATIASHTLAVNLVRF